MFQLGINQSLTLLYNALFLYLGTHPISVNDIKGYYYYDGEIIHKMA